MAEPLWTSEEIVAATGGHLAGAPADGLSAAQVATITDAIVGETDYTAPQIKVIEVKADAQ